jgi:predicted permease
LVLGAVLGSVGVRLGHHLADAARTLAVKLLALPALTILILHLTHLHGMNPLLAQFLVIEAAAAPAVGLILQVRTYGGNDQEVGSVMVLSYAVCTLTLPAWVAVWSVISG